MKVLFVSSGNSINGISPIVKNQGKSLENSMDCSVYYFTIQGKGLVGYLSNIKRLRKVYKEIKPDIVHAHYSLSGFLVTLSGISNVVVSLMGSDVKSKNIFKFFILLFSKLFWKKVIVKSEDMKQSLGYKHACIIPNGIDFNTFLPLSKEEAYRKLSWKLNGKKIILFAANPNREEKNFALAEKAFEYFDKEKYVLKTLVNVPNELMVYYFNVADVVLLTSLWEGSPNVIKEAMACNRPIVCTDVGDVKYNFQDVKGCYIADYDSLDVYNKLEKSIKYKFTNGREKLQILGLSSNSIAKRLIIVYRKAIAI